ncbi:MAG: Co2+/Mg2+ efflux protein ApaG [Candidatus Marinimicrobia bacterium]|jgi:ApaG protein|nr:Co2+/Mg2+ efflux protein ApaG [Candidatus Neomarinimicrobiota bacterium]MBT3848585.1 Co2+/Mg2+ efflux protein ApaG [Candidatus Neomarinimicrobiota bacterium]MBT4054491.1 Co2+/Mg2+ efflux protein ApaG [Candidatus Neomarinimicrobiota bacterium]MBT4383958.1 Co2+/Mg2+ efflux protein ApaG [Candidatus Neomarinimicrobiota bacterium]MBT4660598.1 Co2+/Mg2+ efflux protein ApaG [Candidatus Neomarinimicrobiota bacterium]
MKNSIEINVKPNYVPERSSPVRSYYLFSYHITIFNRGGNQIELLSRYWHITDGHGNTEDIHGPGVIGEQPKILPGELFEYTSFCPLPTPMGFMEGSFRMVDDSGNEFDAIINPFRLVAPQVLN